VPRVGIVVLTYRCNSRCTMCSIWEDKNAVHMPMATLERAFGDPFVANHIRSINLTGGELFLRPDIPAVHALLAQLCGGLDSITINTNGMLIERMARGFAEIVAAQRVARRKVRTLCYISVDGPEEVHDKQRGIRGAYRKVLRTIGMMKGFGDIRLGINFTITRDNYESMGHVLALARELQIDLSYTLAMTSSMYFKNQNLAFKSDGGARFRDTVCGFLEQKLASGELPDPSHYYRNLIGMLQGQARSVGCIFKQDGFFLDPHGDLYPCWGHERKIGNLAHSSFSELWQSAASDGVRACIEESCRRCPNNCYANYQRYDRVQALLRAVSARAPAASAV
jgi:MoaA/NifB/PqqE/SkfB family radical SAM enzyme